LLNLVAKKPFIYTGQQDKDKWSDYLANALRVAMAHCRLMKQVPSRFEQITKGLSAEDKKTGNKNKITITNDKGRLSQEEIDRMVKEAEEFADEDAKVRETIDAKNGFESYVYGVKNALKDDKKADKLSDEDKETVEAEVKKAQEWMDENSKATKDEFDEAKQAMEKVVSPIMSKLYQGGKPPGDEGSSGDSGDDSDEL
jgi:heat shock protein 5